MIKQNFIQFLKVLKLHFVKRINKITKDGYKEEFILW